MALPEMAARIAVPSLILLVAATILGYALQRTLIYYPETADPGTLEPQAARKGLLPWLDAEGNFIGWRSRQGAGIPVLLLHGNAEVVERLNESVRAHEKGAWRRVCRVKRVGVLNLSYYDFPHIFGLSASRDNLP